MTSFIQKHVSLLLIIAGYLITFGFLYANLQAADSSARTAQSEIGKRVERLENERANETRIIVEQHGKRLDKHDEVLQRLQDQTNQILVTLGRIESKLEARKQP